MDKTHHGPFNALFLCNFNSFFNYVGGVQVTNLFSLLWIDWCIMAIQQIITRGALAILFLICSDLLSCFRSVGTMVITTESGYNCLKVIFTEQFLTKVTFFCYFEVGSVQSPWIFQVQAKTSTVRPLFSDYPSISFDYGIIGLSRIKNLTVFLTPINPKRIQE